MIFPLNDFPDLSMVQIEWLGCPASTTIPTTVMVRGIRYDINVTQQRVTVRNELGVGTGHGGIREFLSQANAGYETELAQIFFQPRKTQQAQQPAECFPAQPLPQTGERAMPIPAECEPAIATATQQAARVWRFPDFSALTAAYHQHPADFSKAPFILILGEGMSFRCCPPSTDALGMECSALIEAIFLTCEDASEYLGFPRDGLGDDVLELITQLCGLFGWSMVAGAE